MSVMAIYRQLTKETLQFPTMTRFSDWPQWLQTLVLVPHGILASVACWLWWPRSDKEWRKFGFVVAYLLTFLLVMHYVFQMNFN